MKIYLLHEVPEQITRENIANAYGRSGDVEYVKIKPTPFNQSGRMAVIKMNDSCGRESRVPRQNEQVRRERRLELVKPRPRVKEEEITEEPFSEDKKMHPLVRAFEHLLVVLKGFTSRD